MAEKTADTLNETANANALEREQGRWVTAAVIFLVFATACLVSACVVAASKGNVETALLAAGALMAIFCFFSSTASDELREEIKCGVTDPAHKTGED